MFIKWQISRIHAMQETVGMSTDDRNANFHRLCVNLFMEKDWAAKHIYSGEGEPIKTCRDRSNFSIPFPNNRNHKQQEQEHMDGWMPPDAKRIYILMTLQKRTSRFLPSSSSLWLLLFCFLVVGRTCWGIIDSGGCVHASVDVDDLTVATHCIE